MSRITRADAEIDAKLEREERKRKEAELRAQGIEPPKPDDKGPKTPLGWIATIIGLICLIGFFLVLYSLMRYVVGF